MTFGERIVYLRKEQGITQKELAKKVGVSRQIMRLYEYDLAEPKLFVFMRLADALGVSLDCLARGDKNEV